MPVTNQYLRTGFVGNAEAESVQDALNNLHPAVAPFHAVWGQEAIDSVAPIKLMADYPIDRSATASTTVALPAGQDATIAAARGIPTRFFTRTQTISDGVAASRQSQQIRLYGIEDPLNHGIDQSLMFQMDNWERQFHFGLGTEDIGGVSGTPPGPAPRTHGMMGWLQTGLELRNGTNPALDPVGDGIQAIPRKYWPSFWDAGGTALSKSLYYDQILGPARRRGHITDGSLQFMSDRLMGLVADFGFVMGKGVVNERMIPARDQHLEDIIVTLQTPAYGTVYMVWDSIMSIEGPTTTINNTGGGFVGGAGTVNRSVPWNETLFSVMPDYYDIGVIQPIDWKDLPSAGDYAVGMTIAEKCFRCAHLFGGAGATNLLA